MKDDEEMLDFVLRHGAKPDREALWKAVEDNRTGLVLRFLRTGVDASGLFGPSYMEHNAHLGVQHVLAYASVVLFLIGVGFYISRKLRNTEENILPEGKVTFYGFIETIV